MVACFLLQWLQHPQKRPTYHRVCLIASKIIDAGCQNYFASLCLNLCLCSEGISVGKHIPACLSTLCWVHLSPLLVGGNDGCRILVVGSWDEKQTGLLWDLEDAEYLLHCGSMESLFCRNGRSLRKSIHIDTFVPCQLTCQKRDSQRDAPVEEFPV